MDLGLKGKCALVAAASRGLGYGVAHALAMDGARVALCSRDRAGAESAAVRLATETGSEVFGMGCDMRQPAQVEAWVAAAADRFGQIDALLVNAGGPPAGYFLELSDAQWLEAFELTLMSTIRLIRLVVPHMPPGSAVLTVTSSTIKEPIDRLTLSTVMRAGVAGLVKTLADEFAPRGIRINNLMPGRFDTDRVMQLDQMIAGKSGKTLEQVRADNAAAIPMKRLGTIDEFGAAGAFLLSPAASYITGTSLRVDGGAMRSVSM